MNLHKIISFFLLWVTTFSFGQDIDQRTEKAIITLSVITPTYFTAPRWNLGYIRKVDQRIWVGLELGYGNFQSSIGLAAENTTLIYNNYRLFEIRPEIFYDLRPTSKLKHLVSAELFYINHTDELKDNWYKADGQNLEYAFDRAAYRRHKYGFNINYSLFLNITKRVAVMPKIGFGVKHRDVQFSNVINAQPSNTFLEEDNFIPSVNNYLKNQGSITNFNFNFDLKIAFRIF